MRRLGYRLALCCIPTPRRSAVADRILAGDESGVLERRANGLQILWVGRVAVMLLLALAAAIVYRWAGGSYGTIASPALP